MKPNDQSQAENVDLLRPEICPICAYSLTGLSPAGVCPECGNRYQAGEIVLFGWGTAMNTCGLIQLIWRSLLGATLGIGFILVGRRLNVAFHRVTFTIVGCVTLLCMIGQMARRRHAPLPGPIQVRLSEHGCMQLDNPCTRWRWRFLSHLLSIRVFPIVMIVAIGYGAAFGGSRHGDVLEVVGLVFGFVIASLVVGPRNGDTCTSLPLPDVWTSWTAITEVEIDAIRGSGRYTRIRLGQTVENSEGSGVAYTVNTVVLCLPEKAEAIRRQISQWRQGCAGTED